MKRLLFALSAVCALMISCGTTKTASPGTFSGTGIVAHQGYWNCPEAGLAHNSVAALKAAQDNHFWGSEFDVNMTKDEELVVFHDNRTAGMKFEEHPYADYAEVRLPNGEPIPTLDDYLRQARKCKTTKLVFELKGHSTPELEDRAIELSLAKLRKHHLLRPDRVMFISFSHHACQRFVEWAPGIEVQYLATDIRPEALAKEGLGIDTNYPHIYKDATWLLEARDNHISVNIWTPDKDEDIRRLLQLHPDQLTTNEPILTRNLLNELGINELKLGK